MRVQLDGVPDLATVRAAVPSPDTSGWTLFLLDDDGGIHEVELTAEDTHTVTKIQTDGGADSARVLAGMWTRWMSAAATNAESSAIASTPRLWYSGRSSSVLRTSPQNGSQTSVASSAAACAISPQTRSAEAISSHDLWVVSLELAAVNPAVQEAIRPDRAGWDLAIFDEAHRLTPAAIIALWIDIILLIGKRLPVQGAKTQFVV
ncbi:MAG: hypothetical protein M3070_19075 [Actinomycetota bacterium]|nr:hypothetical protein [Actinomycetota bacterium]